MLKFIIPMSTVVVLLALDRIGASDDHYGWGLFFTVWLCILGQVWLMGRGAVEWARREN